MNERIRELAKEHFCRVEFDNGSAHECYEFSPAELDRFAELIVRECADAIVNDSRLNDVRSAANGCVRTIKQHFGVEE